MTRDESPTDSGGAAPAGDGRLDELPDGVHCVRCGYHLRGVVGPRCPECGYDLAGLRSKESGIPWSHRREIGRFRAYWATVWAVTVRTRSFCEEHVREVNYRDARLFQWVTLVLVFPPIAFGLWDRMFQVRAVLENRLASQRGTFTFPGLTMLEQALLEDWPWVVLTCCLLLFLIAATGVPSYFFHPRESSAGRQNAGIALSYYACGALAIGWIIAVGVAVTVESLAAIERYFYDYAFLDYLNIRTRDVVSVPALVAPVLLWWYTLLRLARGMMPELKRTHLYVGVLVPAVWLLLVGLILFVLPGLCFMGVVFFDSLW